ncbi:hypothetical protein ABZ883_04670 [Streptomyces sp. NPDC046977]|uniref:hypothetical protein n=1 Tax=Streptomyces sp. NPDC046977 TaxID=3154703 RepID=UPI0033E96B2E
MPGHVPRERIEQLLRETGDTLSSSAIARHLGADRHRVTSIRRDLGIPDVPHQPLTLQQKWEQRTRPVDGGHLDWTGERNSKTGTPLLRYWPDTYTAAAVAFEIKYGRKPEGQVIGECDFHQCVAPDHVQDQPGRLRLREQLHFISGGGPLPATCRPRQHDQSVHRAFWPDGTPYCAACPKARRTTTSETT